MSSSELQSCVTAKHGHNTYQWQVLAQIEVQLEALRQHLDARRAASQVDGDKSQ